MITKGLGIMKKLLAIILCLLITLSIVACEKENFTQQNLNDKKDTSSMEESSADEKFPYAFISIQERSLWKEKIIDVLSADDCYEQIEYGCLGVALMDLTFDNTPELLVAYAGGSMGNVCVVSYDLENSEKLCVLGDTPHYKEWDNIYLCVYGSDEGKYLIVNEGSLRSGLEWYMITSTLTDQFKFDVLFEEVTSTEDDNRYYCDGSEVDKAEFEKQKNQFENDYKEIAATQIKIVYWDTIDTGTKSSAISAMADALVNSEQQFVDFNK